ncbi:MAG: putative polymerase subfamily sigma factor, partial [Ilumatobacteraceae bacterium]|nr:putative polymerase subfamily sigma factor [Ilumatobacteraceae bacterium]
MGPTVEEAYEKWAAELTRYAAAIAGPSYAADVVADAFVTMLARGDEAWGRVLEPRRYMYRAVTNAARMRERSHRRRVGRESRWPVDRPIGELIENPEVVAALADLSVRQRAVVFLTYWEDLAP